jgi:hypothetical protein
MPDTHINTKLVSLIQQTTADVRRDTEPAAGAITHHYGIHSVALDVIPAGRYSPRVNDAGFLIFFFSKLFSSYSYAH